MSVEKLSQIDGMVLGGSYEVKNRAKLDWHLNTEVFKSPESCIGLARVTGVQNSV